MIFPPNAVENIVFLNFTECTTTESSDDVEKQDLEDGSDADESFFYDTTETFSELTLSCGSVEGASNSLDKVKDLESQKDDVEKMHDKQRIESSVHFNVQRRKKLPDPVEKEKRVSLWSMIKDNVGKDLTRVCLPVYFNEPISSLQKCCEDMEYSHLLDQAYEYGRQGNNFLRVLKVAAFAVSGYASSEGRHCKPFNPLLGETYEADFPEKGIRFFSEKVSHHPTVIACHCEGRGWRFWGDSNLRSKFWGRSIQLDPVGVLNLEFDDGEIFQWSKVTTNIYNLILGKVYCDHHGTMHIRGNREYSCTLKFKEPSILDRNPHQVHGFIEDANGRKVATIFGKWDEGMYYVEGESNGNPKRNAPPSDELMLWKSEKPAPDLTRYNLTSFAITLNELTLDLKERLPPTDSRLRPDQRHLENGEYEKANEEKQRLERRQRISRKLQDNGWKPRWFYREGEDGPYRYMGGYWEARDEGKWDGCPDVFGELNESMVGELGS
ncbi:oxysterol-binding protein-related protein 2A-like isoform X4 [Benincasa hispida]|uniref:oxysterol-binding protein-related protein 2A-like isoform X4 n=1 Tax=Benincasa hispida TaxID=102211 RepID=UPI0018FFB0A6|nr:oxysterol-binding protein-related protein 2A-like isoform X4 [Benincasa hispida]